MDRKAHYSRVLCGYTSNGSTHEVLPLKTDTSLVNSRVLHITLPRLVFARDYHEFDKMQAQYNQIIDKGFVYVIELGLDETGRYVGLVYTKKRPTEGEINQLLATHPFKLIDRSC